MPIHTFGDSHCFNGWFGPKTHHLGPKLCYSFGKKKLDICNISKFNIKNGDTIIFCFGEIDCRCHVHKHINQTTSYQIIIDDIVDNYFIAIKKNINNSKVKFKNVCVYNVVPPIQKNNTRENPEYPYLGSDEERKEYVLYFNKKLKEKCDEYNYIFFDIYDKYTDKNGFLRKDLSDGNVHIGNGVHISNFITDNKI
jgi:hypothetical protein